MKKLDKFNKIVKLIIVLGVLIRFIFILMIPINKFQFDTGLSKLTSVKDYNNLYQKDIEYQGFDYILTIYKELTLPNSNIGQFYHPPLNFAILALFLRLMDFTRLPSNIKIESLQLLPFIYSVIILIIIKRILDELEISDKSKIFTLIICAFNPLSVIFAGSINNDCLVSLFGILALYFLIKWYKDPNFKNIILISLSLGLGALTKFSILVIDLIVALFFIKKIVEVRDDRTRVKKLIFQFIIAFYIIISLTLLYPLRNYFKFGQPIFEVANAREKFYIGNHSYLERFSPISKDLMISIVTDNDYNLLAYSLKTTINCMGFLDSIWAIIAYDLSIILLFISIIGICRLLGKAKNKLYFIFSIIVTLVWVISFIYFNIKMPYSCSMHARYLFILLTFLAIQLGLILDTCQNKKIIYIIKILVIAYSVISIIVLFQSMFI